MTATSTSTSTTGNTAPEANRQEAAQGGHPAVTAVLGNWRRSIAELRALEAAEHPDIVDGYGRTWIWKNGDLYVHDGLFAIPRDWIAEASLPSFGLAERNLNYAAMCDICRRVA